MKKNRVLQIRLSEQEWQFIEMKMQEHSYTNKSEYILNSIICPVKHNKKRAQSLIYELNKIGVNLNQVVKRMHQTKSFNQEVIDEVKKSNKSFLDLIRVYGGL